MAFWSDANLGQPEPNRNYRFLVQVGDLPPWLAKKVGKPSFAISETEHTYINHKFWYPGRVEWNTVDVTLVDPGGPDVVQSIWNIVRGSGYVMPTDSGTTRTISKAASVDALGMVRIQQIGDQFVGGRGSGNVTQAGSDFPEAPDLGAGQLGSGAIGGDGHEVLEEWILYNAWIKDVKFGDLDYTNNELTEITLTLRYDWAALNEDNEANQSLTTMADSVQGGGAT